MCAHVYRYSHNSDEPEYATVLTAIIVRKAETLFIFFILLPFIFIIDK